MTCSLGRARFKFLSWKISLGIIDTEPFSTSELHIKYVRLNHPIANKLHITNQDNNYEVLVREQYRL